MTKFILDDDVTEIFPNSFVKGTKLADHKSLRGLIEWLLLKYIDQVSIKIVTILIPKIEVQWAERDVVKPQDFTEIRVGCCKQHVCSPEPDDLLNF